MKDIYIEGQSLPEVYHKGISALFTGGQLADCSDWNLQNLDSYSQLECRMTIHVEEPLKEPRISKLVICGPRELEQYRLEILDGILDFAVDVEVERNGRLEALEDYTYHHRITQPIDQIEFVINELKRNPQMSSRRAVIGVRNNLLDSKLTNPACLQNIQFFVRNGKLDMCVLFRSNDFAQAFFMNAFALICMQENLADRLEIPVGTYSQTSNSMHVYQQNFPVFQAYARKVIEEPLTELTYYYEGFFKDLMDAEHDSILEDFKKQREKYGLD
ncbi:MAG: thymidylate synthase [Coriobacteriia bacterium]|nr:thymidylate synthase [Coriobacteriia bacterium]MCL2136650.1 thymidylate synthase [Coriobacteriia bacterium]